MEIRNKELFEEFIKKHVDAKHAFQRWIEIVEEAEWNSHADIKMDFPSADYVGNGRYVFNIRGNNYRLLMLVVFIAGYMKVRFIGTHSEYNKIDCKTI
jgi:mRNA interferase HigB